MDMFVEARLAELDAIYAGDIQEARTEWIVAQEQSAEAREAQSQVEAEDRAYRRADRPEELSWDCPPPTGARSDLDASSRGFAKIQEAGSLVQEFKRRESDARERYTLLFATGAASNFLWTLVMNHRDALVSSWRKLVRVSLFGRVDTSRFEAIWTEFVSDVVQPSMREMCDEHGEPARQAVRDVLATELEVIYQYFATVTQAEETAVRTDDAMTPWEYERLCARLLKDDGWDAKTTAGSGDQGVDVLAEQNGTRIVLQCKLYSKPVGNKAVQEAVAARGHERAHAAAVVSNAGFTRAAEDLAATNGIALLHHSELSRWSSRLLTDVGLAGDKVR